MEDLVVEISIDRVDFRRYPFAPASVFPAGEVDPAAIRDFDVYGAPPEVRLRTGETLFVPGGQGEELRTFCEHHEVPLVRRTDVWDLLLEPFVDTEFTDAMEARTRDELVRAGFTVDEITEIRARFAPAMSAYNAVVWDWAHLGLFDLLHALAGALVEPEHVLDPIEYRETYWWAMEIADRGR